MKYLKFLFFLLPLMLLSCGGDEPEENLFSLDIQLEGEGEVAVGIHDCEITVNGNQQNVAVDLIGDYDSFSIAPEVPEWLYVTTGEHRIKILVPALAGAEPRTGRINFTVTKGSARNSGSITLTQKQRLGAD